MSLTAAESKTTPNAYAAGVQPAIHVITLGVADLERSLAFYRALGLESEGVIGTEFPGGAAAMFELQSGLILAVYGRDDLANDANTTFHAPGSGEFSIGHLVGSRDEVDAVLAEATAAGATLTEEPHDRPWGIYSGYFRDPDGHLWEVIWNPRLASAPA
jgi:catechol 2,3-dioxygenase-like lactoylglutathione lyase family enzyme